MCLDKALHLMCLTKTGGMPLFTRKKGECEDLPLSTVASLNGVAMFCSSQNVTLKTTRVGDWIFIWRDFEDSISLIVAGKEYTEKYLNYLLDLITNTFLLFISLEDFRSPTQNIDRIKREAKNYMPIIEQILNESFKWELLNFNQCILLPENQQLLIKLNEFSVQMGSLFCSIIINKKIAVATEAWWNLDVIDSKLLMMLLNSTNNPTQMDIAVYLPKKSPNTAYRFVTVPITSKIILSVICGAEPQYQDIKLLTQQIFKNESELLEIAEKHNSSLNYLESIDIDSNILGLFFINKTLKKYVISKMIKKSSANRSTWDGIHLIDILKKFYHEAVDIVNVYLNIKKNNVDEKGGDSVARESYWGLEHHKCYSYEDDDGNLLCAFYENSLQSLIIQKITKKTHSKILNDSSICWQ